MFRKVDADALTLREDGRQHSGPPRAISWRSGAFENGDLEWLKGKARL